MNCNEWTRIPAERMLPGVAEGIAAHACEAYPLECCGVLLGSGGRVIAAVRCKNLHPEPGRHFRIDPDELAAIAEEARTRGLAVAGFYHSHPDGSAALSHEDRSDARPWAEFLDMVHAVAAITADGRAEIALFEPASF